MTPQLHIHDCRGWAVSDETGGDDPGQPQINFGGAAEAGDGGR